MYFGLMTWVAGMLQLACFLIREAGGHVFTLDDLVWHESRRIAASTPQLASQWSRLILANET